MMHEVKPEVLLEGPRGRRLCAEIGTHGNGAWPDPNWYELLWKERIRRNSGDTSSSSILISTTNSGASPSPSPPPHKTTLEEIAAISEPDLMWRLADAVTWAMYWQEPDDEDQMLARPEVRQALSPIAEQVLRAEAAQWWDTPLDANRHRYVEWLDRATNGPPSLGSIAESARSWRARAIAREEKAKSFPESLEYPLSGNWWSLPDIDVRVKTSRSLPWLGAVGLLLNEDSFGWKHARVWPLVPNPDARVYEITGPEAWVKLVECYPFDVTLSRRHDWWRATGRAGRWFIPDWQAVAADYDGVHLTVLGYLTTAGRALDLEIDDGATALAGWDPDDTYWLNDVLSHTPSASPVAWRLHDSSTNELYWAPEVDG